jgi:2-(1,2-epoxy-1,2-dihydrophenyl)acetyl-CoA isomerase
VARSVRRTALRGIFSAGGLAWFSTLTEELMSSEGSIEGESELILEVQDGIAYATMNRPSARNALSTPVRQELCSFIEGLASAPDVRVLFLQARGDTFIAGGDLKLFAAGLEMSDEDRAEDMRARAEGAGALCAALSSIPQPVLVAARGHAIGVGASIVFAADLAMVSRTAKLRLSHVSLGLSPDGAATYFLPRKAGLKRATALAMLGDTIDGEEALAMGLVNWVVPDAELEERAESLARRLAAAPGKALAETKRLMRESLNNGLAEQVAAEVESLRQCALTPDYVEGLRAVLEKRAPRFGGQSYAEIVDSLRTEAPRR